MNNNKILRTLAKVLPLFLTLNCLYGSTNLSNTEEQAIQEHFNKMNRAEGGVMFTPPEGWLMADPKALPPSVKIMVVGKGGQAFPPSINLGSEPFPGNLKQYLKTVKSVNTSQGSEWKDLGTILTQAGDASLSQVDVTTEWGDVRMMHVILMHDRQAYILTAAALKNEFQAFYKDFFAAMRSLHINKLEK